jgi:hypothetical protein
VVVAGREVGKPIDVAEPGIVENFIAPWIEVDSSSEGCCLLLQYLLQGCARGGRRIMEDMCYEIRRAEDCVD